MWDKHPEDRKEWSRLWNIERQYALIHTLQPSCLVGSNHHSAPFPGEDIQIFEKDLPGENLSGYSPDEAVKRLRTLGIWMDEYGDTVRATDGGFMKEQPWGVTTRKGNRLFVHVLNHQDSISIPVSGNKLLSAVVYSGGAKAEARQTRDSIVVTVPRPATSIPDNVICLTFRKEL